MLVRFDSKVGQFTMLGDMAVRLLKMMGHSGTVPSAILAADIPAAVERLKAAIEAAPPAPPPEEDDDEEAERDTVPLRHRAVPLIDLLERSAGVGADVLWSEAGSGS